MDVIHLGNQRPTSPRKAGEDRVSMSILLRVSPEAMGALDGCIGWTQGR